MAKKSKTRRKTAKRGNRRGRRVSGFGAGIPMESMIAFGVGAVVSKATNGIVKKVDFLAKEPIIRPILKLGIGYGLMAWKGGGRFVNDSGAGFIAEGTLDFLGVAAPDVFAKLTGEAVHGVGATKVIDLDEVAGYENVDTGVAGYDDDIMVI